MRREKLLDTDSLSLPVSSNSSRGADRFEPKSGLEPHFEAWHSSPISKDVGGVNVGKSPASTPLARRLPSLLTSS